MIRTAGLKLAKAATIQIRGSGYDVARTAFKSARNVDFSLNLNKPYFRNPSSTHFSKMIPKKYAQRISRDRDLSKLL